MKARWLVVAVTLALGLAPAPGRAQEDGDGKQFSAWLGGPAVLHFHPDQAGKYSVGLGVGPVAVNSTDDDGMKIGVMAEYMAYPKGGNAGLAACTRVGAVAGGYIAPGVFYVSRPSGNVVGRVGLMFPFGGEDIVPVLPELAIGIRF